MRLTDRPRTLTEMRAGTRWPPALQAALDRALAREAHARPETATAFARDLLAAVEGMPESAMAQAGTQALAAPAVGAHSLPATRVASAPASRAAAAPPERPGVARSQRRPVLAAAIALGAIVSIGGALVLLRGGDDATANAPAESAPSLALAAEHDTSALAPVAGDTVAATPAPVASRPASVVADPERRDAAGPAPPAIHVQLEEMKRAIDAALERAVEGELDAGTRAALEQVDRKARALLPRIAPDADIDRVDALYFRAAALGLLGASTGDTCDLLAQITGRAGRLTRADEITQLHGSFCRSA